MTEQNTRKGILLMIATTVVFATQDGISRHVASEYNVFMVVMIRYWFFAVSFFWTGVVVCAGLFTIWRAKVKGAKGGAITGPSVRP